MVKNMNRNIKRKIFILAILILCILVISLLYQRILPREFEMFYSLNENDIVSGHVFYPEIGEVEVDSKDMKQLLSLLKSKKYYYEGKTQENIKGSLYHINFKMKEELSSNVVVSNKGYLIIDKKQYRLLPEEDILEDLSKIMNLDR